jgi:ATP-dependent Clp protease, protease subunit
MAEKDTEEKDDSFAKKLLEIRTVMISGSVDSKMSDKVTTQLLVLEKEDPKAEIKVFINSPGGEMHSGYAIYDMLNFVSCPITTVVIGLAASMGSVLSLAGDKKRKLALPNAKIMIHQPLLMGAEGQTTDLEIHSKQIIKSRQDLAELYAEVSGKTANQILKDMDRDHWLTAEEAVKYGLIDKIISSRAELK